MESRHVSVWTQTSPDTVYEFAADLDAPRRLPED
jgi:hypothetical protein